MPIIADEKYEELLSKPDTGPLKPLREVDPENGDPAVGDEPKKPQEATPEAESEREEEPEQEAEAAGELVTEEEPPPPPVVAPTAGAIDAEVLGRAFATALREVVAPPAAPTPREPPAPPPVPAHLKALLESEDEGQRMIGEAWMADHTQLDGRLTALEQRVAAEEDQTIAAAAEQQITDVKQHYIIGTTTDPTTKEVKPVPVDDGVIDKVVDYYEAHPEIAGVLRVSEVLLRLYPDAERTKSKGDTSAAPAGSRKIVTVPNQPPKATPKIVAGGGKPGAPIAKEKAPERETMEQAVARGARKLGLG